MRIHLDQDQDFFYSSVPDCNYNLTHYVYVLCIFIDLTFSMSHYKESKCILLGAK